MSYELTGMSGAGRRVAYRGSLVAAGGLGSLGDDTDGGGGVEDYIHGLIDPITGGGTTETAPPAPPDGNKGEIGDHTGVDPTVIGTMKDPGSGNLPPDYKTIPGTCPDQYKYNGACVCPPDMAQPGGGCYYADKYDAKGVPTGGYKVDKNGNKIATGGGPAKVITPVGPVPPDVQEASMWSNPLVIAAAAAVVGVGVLWYAKKRKTMAKAA